jgi:hypothetical protein
VLDLPLHRDAEERYEVHDEDGPEDRDVEQLEKGTEEGDGGGLGGRVPELELGQAPDERPELLALAGRQPWSAVWGYKQSEFRFPDGRGSPSSWSIISMAAGSILGVRKASRRLRW